MRLIKYQQLVVYLSLVICELRDNERENNLYFVHFTD